MNHRQKCVLWPVVTQGLALIDFHEGVFVQNVSEGTDCINDHLNRDAVHFDTHRWCLLLPDLDQVSTGIHHYC